MTKTSSGTFEFTVAGVDVIGVVAPESQVDAIHIEFTDPGGRTLYTFGAFCSFLAALDFQTGQRKEGVPVEKTEGTLKFSIKGVDDVIVNRAAEGATAALVVKYKKRMELRYECASLRNFFHAIDHAREYAKTRRAQ